MNRRYESSSTIPRRISTARSVSLITGIRAPSVGGGNKLQESWITSDPPYNTPQVLHPVERRRPRRLARRRPAAVPPWHARQRKVSSRVDKEHARMYPSVAFRVLL